MNIIVDGPTDFHEKTDRIKPTSIPVDFATIPETLKSLNLWVVWAYVWKHGRWCKLPFQPVLASDRVPGEDGLEVVRREVERPEHLVGLWRRWLSFISDTRISLTASASCSRMDSWEPISTSAGTRRRARSQSGGWIWYGGVTRTPMSAPARPGSR